jgi:ribonuclease P protein component
MKKIDTLKKSWEFQEIFSKGHSHLNKYFVLYVLPLPPEKKDQLKVGFCVGKKLGHAVQRNKIRRRIKNVFLSFEHEVLRGFAIIIIARGKAREVDFSMLFTALKEVFVKAKIVK